MNRTLVFGLLSLGFGLAQGSEIGQTVAPVALVALQADPAKITVVDFFAEWCISCHKELPLISAAHARSDKNQVEFIGVDTDDSRAVAEAFQKDLRDKGGLSFRVVNDPTQALVKAFKPRGYPALYVLKDGKVVREHLGATPDVDALLEQDFKALGVH